MAPVAKFTSSAVNVPFTVPEAISCRTSFTLSGNERAWVAEIVRRLDGIPLAIELAAARVGVLSLEKLLERLSATFQVLGGGGRSVISRHRTMRNAIDWS